MNIPKICGNCKHFQRNFMDPCECTHKEAPKGYGNITGLHNKPPKWCPLIKLQN